jgi:hypothetical protein
MDQLRALHLQFDRLGLRAQQLGLRLRHVAAGRHAGLVPIPRDLQEPLECHDGFSQQPLLGLVHPPLEPGLHERRLRAQRRRPQIGRARLQRRLAGLDAADGCVPTGRPPS